MRINVVKHAVLVGDGELSFGETRMESTHLRPTEVGSFTGYVLLHLLCQTGLAGF
ncbi:MAG: hypothetical protein ABL921_20000 [Pirellula sp.]